MKRLFDLFLSILLLILLSPVMISLYLIIILTSKGPGIYKQKRIKLNCEEFELYKFRTMYFNQNNPGVYYTSENDTRITKIGKFIRKFSLDELPQLINVIKGDMSLVGPRPDVPAQIDTYTRQNWINRHKLKPGITGLAQALLRSQATAQQRLDLDLKYIEKSNFFYDLYILYLTAVRVISKQGAN